MEVTRTTAGNDLWRELQKTMSPAEAIKEAQRRVQVRTEPAGEDAVRVWTSTDNGQWIDEGIYAA